MISQEHKQHLDRFRIPDELLQAAGVRSVSDFELRDLFGLNGARAGEDLGGILFPYRDPRDGRRWGGRVRLDRPLNEGGKYLSETNNKHLFFPPGCADLLADETVPVVLVEAEKSALALMALAQRHGLRMLPIAVGGCWGWKRKRGKKPKSNGGSEDLTAPSQDFDLITWRNRHTLICFDSNAATKDAVTSARQACSKELVNRKAKVAFVEIPSADGLNGPDDLIAVLGDDAMLAALDEAANPVVILRVGDMPRVVDRAEDVLLQHAERLGIFQRAGALVRVIELPKLISQGKLRVPAGTVMLDPLTIPALVESFDRIAQFQKLNKDGEPRRADCPAKVAVTYGSRRGYWKLPNLTGFISAPIMRLDGSILSRPGFDAETGLFLASKESWPEIPARPTQEDATAALTTLLAPFTQFPFKKVEECPQREHEFRAVHAACLITAIERRILPSAPLFGFSSPAPRSGKTMLAESAAILTTGNPEPPTFPVSRDKEEVRKTIAAILLAGYAIVNLDNVDFVFGSPFLSQAITQASYSDRNLGETKHLQLPTNMLWTATGCNLTFHADLTSRVLMCRIDPEMERPEERRFAIPNLKAHLMENRPLLVTAALTILRAYFVAGCPNQNLVGFGGFDIWSDIIRSALVWAGSADPYGTRETTISEDPEVGSATELLTQLKTEFSDEHFTLKAAVARAKAAAAEINMLDAKAAASEVPLYAALLDVTGEKGDVDMRKFGWWTRRWRDKVIGGLRLRRANPESKDAHALWKVDRPKV